MDHARNACGYVYAPRLPTYPTFLRQAIQRVYGRYKTKQTYSISSKHNLHKENVRKPIPRKHPSGEDTDGRAHARTASSCSLPLYGFSPSQKKQMMQTKTSENPSGTQYVSTKQTSSVTFSKRLLLEKARSSPSAHHGACARAEHPRSRLQFGHTPYPPQLALLRAAGAIIDDCARIGVYLALSEASSLRSSTLHSGKYFFEKLRELNLMNNPVRYEGAQQTTLWKQTRTGSKYVR